MTEAYGMTEVEIERFWNKVTRDSRTECWPWRAGQFKNGYGAFAYADYRPGYAHRFSYLLHHGTIPPGKIVMHSCDNPTCVNPAHLRLGSSSDNTRDSVAKGRWMSPARTAWLEKCPNLLGNQEPGRPGVPWSDQRKQQAKANRKPPREKPLPVGRKYGEIGIPEPGDGYDMGVFVILDRSR